MPTNEQPTFDFCLQQLDQVHARICEGLQQSSCSAIADTAENLSRRPEDLLSALLCLTSFSSCASDQQFRELQQKAVDVAAAMQLLMMGFTAHEKTFANMTSPSHDEVSYQIVLGDYHFAFAYSLVCKLENNSLAQQIAHGIEKLCAMALHSSCGSETDAAGTTPHSQSLSAALLSLSCKAAAVLVNAPQYITDEIHMIGSHIANANSITSSGEPAKNANQELKTAADTARSQEAILRTEPFYGLIDWLGTQSAVEEQNEK